MVNTTEEFQITDDEARRLKDALKNKEFMDLLIDYAKEISDPVNKKKYEEEIIAMEKQRGQDVRLLKPQSGFVIKTVRLSDNMKVFLNICTSPEVAEYELQHVNGRTKVSLPHSLSPEREDFDKGKVVSYYINEGLSLEPFLCNVLFMLQLENPASFMMFASTVNLMTKVLTKRIFVKQ